MTRATRLNRLAAGVISYVVICAPCRARAKPPGRGSSATSRATRRRSHRKVGARKRKSVSPRSVSTNFASASSRGWRRSSAVSRKAWPVLVRLQQQWPTASGQIERLLRKIAAELGISEEELAARGPLQKRDIEV